MEQSTFAGQGMKTLILRQSIAIMMLVGVSTSAFSKNTMEVKSPVSKRALGISTGNFGNVEVHYSLPDVFSGVDLRPNLSLRRWGYGFFSLYLIMAGTDAVVNIHEIKAAGNHTFKFYAGGGAQVGTLVGSNDYGTSSSGLVFSLRGFGGASWKPLDQLSFFLEPAVSFVTVNGFGGMEPVFRLGVNYYI